MWWDLYNQLKTLRKNRLMAPKEEGIFSLDCLYIWVTILALPWVWPASAIVWSTSLKSLFLSLCIQLTLEWHGFKLHRSIHTFFFSINMVPIFSLYTSLSYCGERLVFDWRSQYVESKELRFESWFYLMVSVSWSWVSRLSIPLFLRQR